MKCVICEAPANNYSKKGLHYCDVCFPKRQSSLKYCWKCRRKIPSKCLIMIYHYARKHHICPICQRRYKLHSVSNVQQVVVHLVDIFTTYCIGVRRILYNDDDVLNFIEEIKIYINQFNIIKEQYSDAPEVWKKIIGNYRIPKIKESPIAYLIKNEMNYDIIDYFMNLPDEFHRVIHRETFDGFHRKHYSYAYSALLYSKLDYFWWMIENYPHHKFLWNSFDHIWGQIPMTSKNIIKVLESGYIKKVTDIADIYMTCGDDRDLIISDIIIWGSLNKQKWIDACKEYIIKLFESSFDSDVRERHYSIMHKEKKYDQTHCICSGEPHVKLLKMLETAETAYLYTIMTIASGE